MREYQVWVVEIEIDTCGQISARINCPATAVPKAGQYCLAWSPADSSSSLPMAIFLAQHIEQGFLTAPGMPAAWQPGNLLRLRGPFGNGFHLPHGIQRMALAAFGDSPARLLPLIPQALEQNIAVTLFSQVSPTTPPDRRGNFTSRRASRSNAVGRFSGDRYARSSIKPTFAHS